MYVIAIFTGFHANTSKIVESDPLDVITQNYVQPFKMSLEKINYKVVLDSKEFTMRGIVAFNIPKRGLRATSTGHYTAYAQRSNEKWEMYDDCKDKLINLNKSCLVDIDLIILTV